MKMLPTASCALLLFGFVAAPPAQAQTPWEIGPHLSVDLDKNELVFGAVARIHLSSLPITLNPGLEFYPGIDDRGGLSRSLWVMNFDGQYQLEAESVSPYIGGGHLVGEAFYGNRRCDIGCRPKSEGRHGVQPDG